MPLTRTETNLSTGEVVEIEQKAYSNGLTTIVIDAGAFPPEGFDEIEEPEPSGPSLQDRKSAARAVRDSKLNEFYDSGVMICLRGLRMTVDPVQILYLEGKLAELDAYAVALQNVPQQPGFPDSITWPAEPEA